MTALCTDNNVNTNVPLSQKQSVSVWFSFLSPLQGSLKSHSKHQVGRTTQRSSHPTPGSTQDHTNPNPISESSVPALCELWQHGAVFTTLGSLAHVHSPLVQHLPLTQLHLVPSGSVAVPRDQSSALPSAHCEELQPHKASPP